MQNIEPEVIFSDRPLIHVAVVVILKNDRVLIAKRAKEAHQGGLWEFPGGKIDAGESIEQACVREIQEELGITILHSRPLIKILHRYTDKSVLLETRLCTLFDGIEYQIDEDIEAGKEPQTGKELQPGKELKEKKQFGSEGQLVKWVKTDQLDNYQFPDANKAIIDALLLPEMYVISPDCSNSDSELFIRQFTENCSHYSLIQLRLKSLKGNKLKTLLQACYKIARKKKVILFINSACISAANDAMNCYCDGIHLTSMHLFDNNFIDNFRIRFPEKKISASCHQIKDIEQANHKKLDFIVISPVQQTLTHPQQNPLGWENFRTLCDLAQMPCFALGGMRAEHIRLSQEHGSQGISAISGLWRTCEK